MIDVNLPALQPSTAEDLMELGYYCEKLMSDETFNRLTAMFSHSAFTHFVSTPSHQKDKLQAIHATVDGLQQFLSSMHVLVIAKNKLMNPEGDAEPSDDDALDFTDED